MDSPLDGFCVEGKGSVSWGGHVQRGKDSAKHAFREQVSRQELSQSARRTLARTLKQKLVMWFPCSFLQTSFVVKSVLAKKSLRHRQSHTLMHLHFFGQKCLSKKTGKKTKWRDEMRVRRHGSSFFLKPKTTNDYNTSSDNRTKRQTRWRIDNEPVSLIQRGSWRLKTSRNGRQALWRHGKEGSRK